MACENITTFGSGSTFEFFENQNAEIIMFGCGWDSCSQFHRYEELNKVPYRFYKEFFGLADFGDGEMETRCKMFVRNLDISAQNDFLTTNKAFYRSGKHKSIKFCEGTVRSMNIVDLAKICKSELTNNPLVWVKDREQITQRLRELN